MWVRVGLIAGRVLLRLLIRLAPFLAIGLAAAVRRYRWPIYYRLKALQPGQLDLSAVPVALASSIGALLLLGIGLYLLVGHLSPHP